MKVYTRILELAKPDFYLIPIFLLIALLQTIFQVVNFVMFIPILEVLFSSTNASIVTEVPEFEISTNYFKDLFYFHFQQYLDSTGAFSALKFVCIILLISNLISNTFRYLSGVILAKIRAGVIANLRLKVFQSTTGLHLDYFTETNKGDITSRIMSDAFQIEATVIGSIKVFIKEPLLMLGLFLALFSISLELTLYGLIILPLAAGIISVIAKNLKSKAKESQESLSALTTIIDETFLGIRIVKAFGARWNVIGKFSKEVARLKKLNIAISKRFELSGPISEFLGVTTMAGILLLGGQIILSGNSSLGGPQFITFLIIFSQLLAPLKAFSNSYTNVQKGIAAGERIFELVDTQPKIEDTKGFTGLSEFSDTICFSNVSFGYGADEVIQNVSFQIKKGQTVALVGPSGAGKTTITDLLLRFYDPQKGEITIDGIRLPNYKIEDLRKQIGVVTQDSILFNDSVRNNIAFGNSNLGIEQIRNAAELANAHNFIEQLEYGYDTQIGERGEKLSGGQKQRITIARALAMDPSILIFDEATSSLDAESEMQLQSALKKVMKNRTSLVIAHRLSTIQEADKIIVIDRGQIIETGNHNELYSNAGLYKKLIDMQSF